MLSNAQERLGRATLSVALSFHLIDLFVSRMPVGYLVSDITQFFQRSPGSQRIEGTHSEIADLMACACMYGGAYWTTHSGIIGDSLSTSAASRVELDVSLNTDLSQYGLARREVFGILAARILDHIDNLPPVTSENISTSVKELVMIIGSINLLPLGADIDSSAVVLWSKTLFARVLHLLGQVNLSAVEKNIIGECIGPVKTLKIVSSLIKNEIPTLRLPRWSRLLPAPPIVLNNCSSLDVDVILMEKYPVAGSVAAKEYSASFKLRFSVPVTSWIQYTTETFGTRYQQKGVIEAAHFLWPSLDYFWEFVDYNVNLIFHDRRYQISPKQNLRPAMTLGLLRIREMQLNYFGVLMHRNVPQGHWLKGASLEKVMKILDRTSLLCDQLAALKSPLSPASQLSADSAITDVVGKVPIKDLAQWVRNDPQTARRLVSGLRIASFSLPVAARAVCDIKNVLMGISTQQEVLSPKLNVKNSFPTALPDRNATRRISRDASNAESQAETMVQAALESLVGGTHERERHERERYAKEMVANVLIAMEHGEGRKFHSP